MDIYWVPGVNHTKKFGRWAFAEFTDVFQIGSDFAKAVEKHFNEMVDQFSILRPVGSEVTS